MKVKKNIKKISAWFLAFCQENWGSGKKLVFLLKKACTVFRLWVKKLSVTHKWEYLSSELCSNLLIC